MSEQGFYEGNGAASCFLVLERIGDEPETNVRTSVSGSTRGIERRSSIDVEEERDRGGVGKRRSGTGLAGSNPGLLFTFVQKDAIELRDEGIAKGGDGKVTVAG